VKPYGYRHHRYPVRGCTCRMCVALFDSAKFKWKRRERQRARMECRMAASKWQAIGLAVGILLGGACTPARPPLNPDGGASCPAACARLRVLGCPWAAPTPAGATCEQRCEATESTGYTTAHPQCVAVARDCDEADRVSAEGCE